MLLDHCTGIVPGFSSAACQISLGSVKKKNVCMHVRCCHKIKPPLPFLCFPILPVAGLPKMCSALSVSSAGCCCCKRGGAK